MIEVTDFCKIYQETIAVDRLNLRVEPGQILGLVGPNGAGKTTTMRCLAGIIPPSHGSLRVGPHDVVKSPMAAKAILAYIPDDPQLFRDLTVRQHLAFTASAYRVSRPEQRVRRLVSEFIMETRLDTRVADLSRGMRQKLAILCAYLYDPQVLLFDEPLTGLDPQGIRVLKQSIRARAEAGAAVIISSHLLAMVEDICTHVLVLESGSARFWGTFAELKETFADQHDASSLEEIFFRATAAREQPTAEANLACSS